MSSETKIRTITVLIDGEYITVRPYDFILDLLRWLADYAAREKV